jgi:hypothetical protein
LQETVWQKERDKRCLCHSKEKRMENMKPSEKRIKYLIKDEKKASKEYRKYGYESKHRRFLEKKLKQHERKERR